MMMTSSNGNISTLQALCEKGKPPVTGGFRSQRPVSWGFGVSFGELTVEQTIETPVIWDAIALIMLSL